MEELEEYVQNHIDGIEWAMSNESAKTVVVVLEDKSRKSLGGGENPVRVQGDKLYHVLVHKRSGKLCASH